MQDTLIKNLKNSNRENTMDIGRKMDDATFKTIVKTAAERICDMRKYNKQLKKTK